MKMMLKRIFQVLCLMLASGALCAQAAIVTGGTRFIYNSNAESLTVNVRNTATDSYLVKTTIIAGEQDGNVAPVPFVATPPLFLLKGGRENTLRILFTGGNLPTDRESVFWLTIAGIPTTPSAGGSNTVQVALRNRMKLFWRPANLQGNTAEAYRHLTWSRTGDRVVVTNPTPWYVTLIRLTSNGQPLPEPGMVAPFSSLSESWCPRQGNCKLQWQTLNDYGTLQPAVSVVPTATPQEGHP